MTDAGGVTDGATPPGPLVLVVMAVFRPNPDHLRAQLASLAAQTHRPLRLIAVIADTVSTDLVRAQAGDLGLDLVTVPCDMTLDSVRAFEAGLEIAMIQPEVAAATFPDATNPVPLIALSDQDDIWHEDRLARGVAALADAPGAQMVHSDVRLVAEDGTTVLRPSIFKFEQRHRKPGLRGLLYRNNVTGMTVLMRADVARVALPFPPQSGVHFYHDLWLALIAQVMGGVVLIEAPLVDYRQHGTNAIGAVDREGGWLGNRAHKKQRPDMMWLRREAAGYALARYLAQATQNRLVDAVDDGRLAPGRVDTRPLRPFLRRFRGAGLHLWDALGLTLRGKSTLARIAAGFAVVQVSRNIWVLREAAGPGLNGAVDQFDTRLFSLSPGMPPPVPKAMGDRAAAARKAVAWEDLTDRRKVPGWSMDLVAETPALCILVPTLNPTEIFAGVATALDIGLGLAARGFHVRFIATDLPVSSPAASRAFLMGRAGQGGTDTAFARRITLFSGVQGDRVPGHAGDMFLATAWWSAHIADSLIRSHELKKRRFLYLIQDHEPNFYAWGPEYADAAASYEFNFEPVFNTTLLRDFFAEKGHAFATGDALAFHPAIDIDRYARAPRPARVDGAPRRLAVYGRPEVARNMYPTAIEALALFIAAENLTPDDIELVSIGMQHAPVHLPHDLRLTSLGKLAWEAYPAYLRGVDLGLSLMYSPHPSHPPLEMAASGVRVVTNGFGPKDLGLLSPAIASTAPTAPALAEALGTAWHAGPLEDGARRIDLGHLGLDMETLLDRLAGRLFGRLPRDAQAPGPAMTRRVVLHIGSPKCGSTFLQRTLVNNRALLAEHGFAYPHPGQGHPGNAANLRSVTADRLEDWFGDAHTLLLSHEDLYSNAVWGDRLAALTRAKGIEVQLVAFMRPFCDFIFGDYSQHMKQNFDDWLADRNPYAGRSFREFAVHRGDPLTPAAFLRHWQSRFAALPMIVAPHTEIRAVYDRLLGGDPALDWTVPHHITNPSFRIEDCDRIAAALRDPEMPDDRIRAMFDAAFESCLRGDFDPGDDAGRSMARKIWVEEQFADRNAELMEQFGYDNRLPGLRASGLSEADPHRSAPIAPDPVKVGSDPR